MNGHRECGFDRVELRGCEESHVVANSKGGANAIGLRHDHACVAVGQLCARVIAGDEQCPAGVEACWRSMAEHPLLDCAVPCLGAEWPMLVGAQHAHTREFVQGIGGSVVECCGE